MYILQVKQHFDAAHYLNGYEGDCAKLHGHRWEVEIHLAYDKLDNLGMAVDFKSVKATLKELLPDHKCLNDIYTFNPTAENLAKYLYEEIKVIYNYHLTRIKIWESPDCCIEYYE